MKWFSFSSFIKWSRKYVSELKCPEFGAQNLNWKRIKEMYMAAYYSFVHTYTFILQFFY